MNDKRFLTEQLQQAIDQGDLEAVDRCLDALSALGAEPIVAEKPTDFAARILLMDKENRPMKLSKHTARVLAAAAAISILAVTVYAATTLNLFSFQSGDRFVTLSTNQQMTEQEAKAIVEENQSQATNISDEEKESKTIPSQEFESMQAAEAALDIDLILPTAMPKMNLDSVSGQEHFFGENAHSRTVWLTYFDDAGRMLGVTTVRETIPEGEALTSYTLSDMDPGSLGSYKSKSGITFTTLSESDPTGEKTAHIATVMIGEYEYSLVFLGFDEQERQAIIDSCDLSAYGK